jgi:hypothetical protein
MDTTALTIDAPATAAGEDARAPARLPVVALYAVVLATGGLFLPVWTYRLARTLPGRPVGRLQGGMWAAAAMLPVFSWAILFELGRRTTLWERARGRRRESRELMPVLWLVAIEVVLYASPLRTVVTAHLVAVTLPFLVVQARINGAQAVAPTEARWPALVLAIVALFGAFPAWWLFRRMDRSDWAFASSLRTLGRRELRVGREGVYELTAPEGWVRVAPGVMGSAGSDVELTRMDRTASVVTYVEPKGALTLAGLVAARRRLLAGAGSIAGLHELRSFLPGASYQPVSYARYQLGARGQRETWVLTAEVRDHLVEIVFNTSVPSRDEATAHALMSSFAAKEAK